MKKIILFVTCLIIINQLLSVGFYQIMSKSQLYLSDAKLNEPNQDITNLISGNSHALAIQSNMLDKAINISSYGEEIHNSYYKLSNLIKENGTVPKRLLLSCDLGLLKAKEIDQQNYQFYWNNYENHIELFQFSTDQVSFIMNRIVDYIFPYRDGEIEVFDYLFSDTQKTHLAQLRDTTNIEPLIDAHEKDLSKECLQKQFSIQGDFYIRKIIEMCNQNNIQLVLIRFPITPKYQFDQSICFDPTQYYDIFYERYLHNNPNVILLDMHDIFDESQFRDPHHLKKGQVRTDFTSLLSKRLNEIESQ